MTWHNLPCPPTLHAIAAACPRGWIEFNVSHYSGDSGPGGSHPQEPDTFLDNRRMWGIDSDDQQEMLMMWSALPGRSRFEPWRLGKGVPHGATVLARIERAPLRCNLCGGPCDEKTMSCARGWDIDQSAEVHDGCLGVAIIEIDLVTTWGTDGKPVYWTGETPDYSGQQAAPNPGRGDMWASLIERVEARRLAPPRIIEMLKARRQLGIERYGTVLQADNGRDAIRDAIEETLDRMVYLEQINYEHNDHRLHHELAGMQGDDLRVLCILDTFAREALGR